MANWMRFDSRAIRLTWRWPHFSLAIIAHSIHLPIKYKNVRKVHLPSIHVQRILFYRSLNFVSFRCRLAAIRPFIFIIHAHTSMLYTNQNVFSSKLYITCPIFTSNYARIKQIFLYLFLYLFIYTFISHFFFFFMFLYLFFVVLLYTKICLRY